MITLYSLIWSLLSIRRTISLQVIYLFSLISFPTLYHAYPNLLQCSCLENPVDRGAWWAAVYAVAQSQAQSQTPSQTQLSMHACIGEGNGNPLQYSCLENPRDRGAWWAAVYGVAQSQTQLIMHACIGEGNGNPLQYSCLENPRDRGAWWAAVYGVAQSQTQLKRLSSSSSSIMLIHCLFEYCFPQFSIFARARGNRKSENKTINK